MNASLNDRLGRLQGEAERKFRFLVRPEQVPTRKSENYRYTSLRGIDFSRAPAISTDRSHIPDPLCEKGVEEECVLLNSGSTFKVLGALGNKEIIFSKFRSFNEMSAGLNERLENYLCVPKVFDDDLFAQWVASKETGANLIYIPKGVRSGSLRTTHFFEAGSRSFFYRTIIVVDEGAELDYTEEFLGNGFLNGTSPLANGLVQLYALPGAKVRYSQSVLWGESVQCFGRQNIVAFKDAEVEMCSFLKGGAKTQVRTEVECSGKGASIRVLSAAKGKRNQHFDFWVTSHHGISDTMSEVEHRSILDDEARSIFNGNILIDKGASRTDATQKNKNMVLSPRAVVNTVPKLEIATDDVKCAHGAMIVPIDEDQLYYLNSRGISRSTAEEMIIEGFVEPVIAKISSSVVQKRSRSNVPFSLSERKE